MTTKRLMSLAAAGLMVLGVASLAMANVPDGALSTATSASGCLRVVPDGTGDALSAGGLTVTVTVNDGNGNPIAGYPFQDVNLVDNAGGADVSLCTSGWAASANTNASGVTTITGPGFGGGSTQSGMRVSLAGTVVTGSPALSIDVVSADMDGNLSVALLDLSAVPSGFAARFQNGVYDFESDYNCDGTENLLDVTKFAIDNGAVCP